MPLDFAKPIIYTFLQKKQNLLLRMLHLLAGYFVAFVYQPLSRLSDYCAINPLLRPRLYSCIDILHYYISIALSSHLKVIINFWLQDLVEIALVAQHYMQIQKYCAVL